MFRSLAIGTLLAVAAVACFGSGDSGPTPTPTPSASPTATPTPTSLLAADEYWFVGIVREVNSGCAVDAICSVTVEVSKNIDGGGLPVGETVEVIETFGFSTRRCFGDWSSSAQIGDEVEVLAAREDDERLQICDSERYFVKLINVAHDANDYPTPTPTPTPLVAPDEYWFMGTAREIDRPGIDGPLLVTVEVDRSLGGVTLPVGETVVVNAGGGFTRVPCRGEQELPDVGDEVEVLAGPDDYKDMQVCDDARYFMRIIPVPTPSPTPHDASLDSRFMGVVREVFPCPSNGRCWIDVEVWKNFDGVNLPVGESVNVIGGGNAFVPCLGDWIDKISVGDEVEVLAETGSGIWLSVCDSALYFVRYNNDHLTPPVTPTPSSG